MLPTYAQALITYVFTAMLAGMGVLGLANKRFYYANIFHPHVVYRGKRLWTLFSACLVHVDWKHLLANTLIFLFLLAEVEYMLIDDVGKTLGRVLTATLLVGIVVSCNLVDLFRFRNRMEVTTAGMSAFNYAMIIFYYVYLPVGDWEYQGFLLPITEAYQVAGLLLLMMGIACWMKLGRNPVAHLIGGFAGLAAAVIIRPQLVTEVIRHLRQ